MKPRQVIRLFYAFQFFFSLLLWAPIFYEYQKLMGLNDEQIFHIQSIYYIAFCLFEFPTGFLADRWSHRRCMQLGSLILLGGNLLPIFAPDYQGFLWHWLAVALSRSLISGASSAYLYNFLERYQARELYKGTEGWARSYSLIGKVVGWAGIGYLMEWHVTLPYWLTAFSAGIAFICALRLPAGTGEPRQAGLGLAPLVHNLIGSPYLILLMFQGIGIFVLARILQVNLFQPVLVEKGFDVAALGVIMSINTLFEALGSAYPGVLRRYLSDLNAVFLLTAVMAASMALTARGGPIQSVLWLSVFALATGLSYPIQRQVLNDAISDSRFRASLLSAESLLDRAVCAWVAAQIGGYVAAGRTDQFLYLGAQITVVGVLVLMAALALVKKPTPST